MKSESDKLIALLLFACLCAFVVFDVRESKRNRTQWHDVVTAFRNGEFQHGTSVLCTIPVDTSRIAEFRVRISEIRDAINTDDEASFVVKALTRQVVAAAMSGDRCQSSVELLILVIHRFPHIEEASPNYFESEFAVIERMQGNAMVTSGCDRILHHSNTIKAERRPL